MQKKFSDYIFTFFELYHSFLVFRWISFSNRAIYLPAAFLFIFSLCRGLLFEHCVLAGTPAQIAEGSTTSTSE